MNAAADAAADVGMGMDVGMGFTPQAAKAQVNAQNNINFKVGDNLGMFTDLMGITSNGEQGYGQQRHQDNECHHEPMFPDADPNGMVWSIPNRS